jgi:hypothetical protein
METTFYLDCVLFNSLVCSDLFNGTTYPVLLILAPLFILVIGQYLDPKKRADQERILIEQSEGIVLRTLMLKVMDISFRRTPIVCSTSYEEAYYKNLFKHYNNVGRCVELIERKRTETNHEYAAIKDRFNDYYCSVHKDLIDVGEANAGQYWDQLIKDGLLDYCKTPKGPKWEISKKYIDNVTKYIIENDRPRPSDQAKKKLVLDVMPSDRIG